MLPCIRVSKSLKFRSNENWELVEFSKAITLKSYRCCCWVFCCFAFSLSVSLVMIETFYSLEAS